MKKIMKTLKKWYKAEPGWCTWDCFNIIFDSALTVLWFAVGKPIIALFLIATAMLVVSSAVRRFARFW